MVKWPPVYVKVEDAFALKLTNFKRHIDLCSAYNWVQVSYETLSTAACFDKTYLPLSNSAPSSYNFVHHMFRIYRVWQDKQRRNCSLQYGVTDIRVVDCGVLILCNDNCYLLHVCLIGANFPRSNIHFPNELNNFVHPFVFWKASKKLCYAEQSMIPPQHVEQGYIQVSMDTKQV